MPQWPERMLYVCGDPGIPIGGTKGGSVHVREFLTALAGEGVDATVVAARVSPDAHGESPFRVHTPGKDPLASFYQSIGEGGPDTDTRRQLRLFGLNYAFSHVLHDVGAHDQFDCVYERYSLFGVAGRVFAKSRGIPHVLEVNAPLVREAARYRNLSTTDLASGVERYLFETTDRIVAVSETIREYVLRIAPGRPVDTVPNGVDPKRFAPPRDHPANGPFVIGFVGAIRPWHGVERLTDALPHLIDQDPAIHLRIVGDKGASGESMEARCREQGVSDHVTLTGPVPFESIPGELAHMDVVVAPYPPMQEFYFSPLKVYEYMAAGKAIVASAIGQITDILQHERNAILVPPDDDAGLRQAILRLRKDTPLRLRLARTAREDALALHTWRHRMRDLLQRLSQLQPGDVTHREAACG